MLTPKECGKRCRIAFGEHFKPDWGSYRLKGRKIFFKDNTIFILYSDFHEDISQWFYNVPKSEWKDWQNQSLAILLKESNEVNYVLLNPNESVTLLSKCDPVSNEKKTLTSEDQEMGEESILLNGRIFLWQADIVPCKCHGFDNPFSNLTKACTPAVPIQKATSSACCSQPQNRLMSIRYKDYL